MQRKSKASVPGEAAPDRDRQIAAAWDSLAKTLRSERRKLTRASAPDELLAELEAREKAAWVAFTALLVRKRQQAPGGPELVPAYFALLRKTEIPALVGLVGELVNALEVIERGRGDVKSRAQSMRKLLIQLRFVVKKPTPSIQDGSDWLLRVCHHGDTEEEALIHVARSSGRSRGAVRRNVDRFLSRGLKPFFRVPQLRDDG